MHLFWKFCRLVSDIQTPVNRADGTMEPGAANNRMPGGGGRAFSASDRMNPSEQPVSNNSTVPLLVVSVFVLLVGMVVVKKYRH